MKEMVENLKAISLLFCFIVAFGAIALAPQVLPANLPRGKRIAGGRRLTGSATRH